MKRDWKRFDLENYNRKTFGFLTFMLSWIAFLLCDSCVTNFGKGRYRLHEVQDVE